MAIYRKIAEVVDKEKVADLITDSGFNFVVLEDLPNGNSIIEFNMSDNVALQPKHRKNLGDLTSLMATNKLFVRWLPSHVGSPAKIIQVFKIVAGKETIIEEG